MVANAKGAIRDVAAYARAAQRRHTERFDDCFPRGISLGDIDSFVEINKHFLFLEWKVANQQISTGQWMAFERLAVQPKTTVWVIWTDDNGTITHAMDMKRKRYRKPVSEDVVRAALKDWVSKAEAAK